MADHPAESVSTNEQNEHYPAVAALLTEVNALAIRLNQAGRGQDSANGLPAAAYGVLQLLQRHGPHTVPQLARRRSTSRQNIQIVINRLKSQGCVELANNPAHRRSALVNLTSGGQALLIQGAQGYHRMLETLASAIGESELASATRLLNGIRQLLAVEKAPAAAARHLRKTSKPRSESPSPARLEKPGPPAPQPAVAKPVAEKTSVDEEEFPVSLL
ncbi:MAG TPA: MarR family transcriptional regulator [Candidatus Acidoferrum sp.]|nr:MarR family transcriptional regulator [Candidatus Acidoferrum sp.]